jgi:hypothetical protein
MAQGASLLASNFNNSPYFKINYFYLLACIYVLLPIPFDFLYKTEVLMLPVSAALRVTILLLMIWLKRHRLRISSLCLVLAIFCIFTIILGAKNTIGQYGSPYLIVKMVVVVGLVIILYDTLSTDDSTVLIKFFLVIYSANVIPVMLGATFGIDEFKTGGSNHRFGYSGLLPTAGNESAIFLMVMFTAVYFNRFHTNYLNIKPSYSACILISILISMVLTGSKLATLYPIILFISHRLTTRHSHWVILLVSTICILIYTNIEKIRVVYSYLFDYYSARGLLSTLLMSRDTRLASYDLEFSNLGFFLGNARSMVNLEMDFFTIYYNLGVFGLIILLGPFFYHLIPRLRTRISFAYSISLTTTIILTGHVVESGFLLVPLVALSKVLSDYERNPLRY